MSRTYRKGWKFVEDKLGRPDRLNEMVKVPEGRPGAMSSPYCCEWCNFKTKKFWDNKSGIEDWEYWEDDNESE